MATLTYEQNRALADLYRILKEEKPFFVKAKILFEKKYPKSVIQQLLIKNMLRKRSHQIQLTDQGFAAGYRAARVITVFKAFCQDILELSQKETENYIEKLFDSVDDYIIEKHCALIGHARRDIVAGECCRRAQTEVTEQILPLSRLSVNTPANVVYIKTSVGAVMQKLFDLGIYPGKTIRIHQLYPAYIIIVDQQEIALESALAEFIFVRK